MSETMMNPEDKKTPTADLVERVELGMVIQQSRENAAQLADLRKSTSEQMQAFENKVTIGFDKLAGSIQSLSDTLHRRINETREAATPSSATMVKWASLVLLLVSMGAGVFTYIFGMWQRATMDRVDYAERMASEWREANRTRIERLEHWQEDQIKAELAELRERRREDGKQP